MDLVLASLRGEHLRRHPLHLPIDQAVSAVNVELQDVGLARRRKGSTSVDETDVTQIQWFDGELWALTAAGALVRDLLGTPSTLDTGVTGPLAFQALHGKLYIGGLDGTRLSVWDGSSLRLTGLAEPAAPTAGDSGSGAFAGVRHYRVRFVEEDGSGTVVRRSEPSEALVFTPSGSGSSAVVTRPALLNEGETHWELEASIDGATFYPLVVSLPVGTTTYPDTQAYSAGYANNGFPLSEPIGAYALIPDADLLAANHDRLIVVTGSRVYWTPNALDPGDADDERIDLTADPFVDLDTELGDIRAVSSPVFDYVWLFKTSGVYQLVRTGVRARAYRADLITRDRGAVPGSVVAAHDVDGYPAVFFVDSLTGPHIISRQGIQWIASDYAPVQAGTFFWGGITAGAFDALHRRILWARPTSDEAYVLHLDKMDITARSGGWVRWAWPDTVTLAVAAPGVLYAGGEDGVRQLGTDTTTDSGAAFAASVTFRPLVGPALTGRFGLLKGALATAGAAQTVKVIVRQDFGATAMYERDLACEAGDHVIDLDDLGIQDAETVHVTIGDGDTVTAWAVEQIHLRPTGGAQ